jgi:hypothetical protein
VGLVVDNVTLGHVFSEYFGFPFQFSFHRLLQAHQLSSGAGTVGQTVADIISGLGLTAAQETKKKNLVLGQWSASKNVSTEAENTVGSATRQRLMKTPQIENT